MVQVGRTDECVVCFFDEGHITNVLSYQCDGETVGRLLSYINSHSKWRPSRTGPDRAEPGWTGPVRAYERRCSWRATLLEQT